VIGLLLIARLFSGRAPVFVLHSAGADPLAREVLMRRREFIIGLGGFFAAHPLARAQQRSMPVVGFLNGASAELSANYVAPFRQGLAEQGYLEGKNVVIEFRWANGRYAQLPALAAEVVRLNVDVIAATSTPAGLPAKAATSTIPIVFVTGSDPIEQGLVPNLNRPGGNITGITTLAVELGQKRMELMREVVPSARLFGVLVNPTGPNIESVSRDLTDASKKIGQANHVLHASTVSEMESAFAAFRELHASAVVIGTDTFFNSQSATLAKLALRHAMPAIYQYREFVAAGGLMSYAGSIVDAYRVAGVYTGRVLKGEKPSELPVQQSTKAELFVNLKTANALGLTIPPTLLARADEVIE
jgi:putative tryptophan/tyrosine transport system substrate-binding protein